MPFVTVYVKSKVDQDLRVRLVHGVLPEAVATALSVESNPEAQLNPEEIAVVLFEPAAISGCVAKMNHDIDITIDANDFPERRELLETAAASIFDKVKAVAPEHTIGVWPGLKIAAWIES